MAEYRNRTNRDCQFDPKEVNVAEVTLVAATSHSPFLYNPPEQWNETRDARPVRADVPYDSVETNIEKFKRCMAAFDVLRERVQEAKPDVLLIFGDDQNEVFHFDNFPAFGLFLGAEFEGYRTTGGPSLGSPRRPATRRTG